ncbi:glycosyl transferase [Ravibacter arvi]|uniref:Glycosyl transferase n=1 Tax=Ravibacter arvi TaxID=2051041 RepID=A0ABP8M2G7_9BACT
MQYFCTLFNSGYLSRGLAMYESLVFSARDSHLFIVAFDEPCFKTLQNLFLANATIISLESFEREELLAVKDDRTTGEYCWTCTSWVIWYCIQTYALDHCTYLDADLLFFADPKVLTDEMGDNSVLITEHRYSARYDQSALCGIYCVQFMTFRNTPAGLTVLDWWRKACVDWCYSRIEDGKFGDQKYLDDWPERFEGVHVLKNIGGGVAPWNNREYRFEKAGDGVRVKQLHQSQRLVFYHFHDFRYCTGDTFRLTSEWYAIKKQVVDLVYRPYVKALETAEKKILQTGPSVTFHEPLYPLDWLSEKLGRKLAFRLKGYYKNYYRRKKISQ